MSKKDPEVISVFGRAKSKPWPQAQTVNRQGWDGIEKCEHDVYLPGPARLIRKEKTMKKPILKTRKVKSVVAGPSAASTVI